MSIILGSSYYHKISRVKKILSIFLFFFVVEWWGGGGGGG